MGECCGRRSGHQEPVPGARPAGRQQVVDGATGRQSPRLQDADRVTQGLEAVQLVRADEHGACAAGDQSAQVGEQLLGRLRVEPGGRLVEEQELWPVQDGAREGGLLPHPLAEGAHLRAEPVGQPQQLDHVVDPPGDFRAGHVVELGPGGEVVAQGQCLVEARVGLDPDAGAELVGAGRRQRLAEEPDGARGRAQHAGQQPDCRRLPRAVGAEQPEGCATGHLERDTVDRDPVAEVPGDPVGGDRRRDTHGTSRCISVLRH